MPWRPLVAEPSRKGRPRMRRLLVDAAHTLVPPKGDRHGPLPPLLLTLTVVTGLVDAVSYLALGHVFVANMTGNVVFLGFALAGAEGLSAWASLAAMAAFLVGAVAGGRFGTRFADHRGKLLASATTLQALLVSVALVTVLVTHDRLAAPGRYVLIVTLALAMGLQNAAVRRLGVPDLTTTVLTQTLTGLASDPGAAGGWGAVGCPFAYRRGCPLGERRSRRRAADHRRTAGAGQGDRHLGRLLRGSGDADGLRRAAG